MGFTWIHLNQVNVGTNVAVGYASYQRWCTLTGVSTCATVNMCTKHKKRCSKGNPMYVYSTYTKDKRIRSTVLKKDRDAENKNTWTEMALPLQAGGLPNATQGMSRFVSFTTQTRSSRKRGSSTHKQRF